MYNFLAWVAAQGIKHIPKRLLIQAFNSFKGKLPGNQVILKTAKNLWDDVIKKTSTKDLTKQVRQKIKEDKLLDFNVPFRNRTSQKIIEQVKKNTSPKQWEKIIENLEGIKIPKEPFMGFIPRIVPRVVKPRVVKPRVVKPRVIKPKKIVPKKPDTLKDILEGKPHIDKQGRSWEFQKVPHPKGPAKIIPFPKITRKPKADGGSIDKALPGRSRDI